MRSTFYSSNICSLIPGSNAICVFPVGISGCYSSTNKNADFQGRRGPPI